MIKRNRTLSDDGFMATEWVAAVGLLLIPCFVIVLSLVQVPPRQALAEVASSEAARAYVQALNKGQAETAARAAAVDAILSETGERDRLETETVNAILTDLEVTVEVVNTGSTYCGGSEFTLRVEVPMPVTINPFNDNSSLFTVARLSSTSTERIDDYAELTSSPADLVECDV